MTSKVYGFAEQYSIGKHGERQAVDILRRNGWTVDVVDDIDRQRLGVDAIISRPDAGRFTLEVKTDMKATKTKNLFLEDRITRKHVVRDGWLWSCTAQLIGFLIPYSDTPQLLLTHTSQLRHLIHNDGDKFRYFEHVRNIDYEASGYLVPIEVVAQIREGRKL